MGSSIIEINNKSTPLIHKPYHLTPSILSSDWEKLIDFDSIKHLKFEVYDDDDKNVYNDYNTSNKLLTATILPNDILNGL